MLKDPSHPASYRIMPAALLAFADQTRLLGLSCKLGRGCYLTGKTRT
jgi:hypothetical protein